MTPLQHVTETQFGAGCHTINSLIDRLNENTALIKENTALIEKIRQIVLNGLLEKDDPDLYSEVHTLQQVHRKLEEKLTELTNKLAESDARIGKLEVNSEYLDALTPDENITNQRFRDIEKTVQSLKELLTHEIQAVKEQNPRPDVLKTERGFEGVRSTLKKQPRFLRTPLSRTSSLKFSLENSPEQKKNSSITESSENAAKQQRKIVRLSPDLREGHVSSGRKVFASRSLIKSDSERRISKKPGGDSPNLSNSFF